MTYKLRPGLPELPVRIKMLPVDERGWPVPWFVEWIDGKPEFRAADPRKLLRAVREQLCWTCGGHLGSYMAFVVGPMCAINRISAEPPSHQDCAEFSAKACPFLSMPKMIRREAGLPEEVRSPPGVFLQRNPGVALIWTTRSYGLSRLPNGYLFAMGEPSALLWFCEGRQATREEIVESIDSGLPLLRQSATGPGDEEELDRRYHQILARAVPAR